MNLCRDLIGTIVSIGDDDTLRRNTAKVKWDCGYNDQWWPLNTLYPAVAPAIGGVA